MRCAILALLLTGCASFQTMTAPSADLDDYRAFRVAGAEGTRLARAQAYLDRHPDGVWSKEVKAEFDDEEPRWFEESQGTREGIRRYIADLPHGPHADAARALLVAMGSTMEDAELRDLVRRVRLDDAKLETAAQQRRAVGEAILGALGVLLDEDNYGNPLSEAPPALRTLMLGKQAPTWGSVPSAREDDYFYLLPTRPERSSRLLTLETKLQEQDGVIVGARLEGMDLVVRWAEAEQIVRLDAAAPEDRTEAQVFAMSRLEGALERRFPAASCQDLRTGNELYHRACNGWEGTVVVGENAGDKDAVILRSPRARKRATGR